MNQITFTDLKQGSKTIEEAFSISKSDIEVFVQPMVEIVTKLNHRKIDYPEALRLANNLGRTKVESVYLIWKLVTLIDEGKSRGQGGVPCPSLLDSMN